MSKVLELISTQALFDWTGYAALQLLNSCYGILHDKSIAPNDPHSKQIRMLFCFPDKDKLTVLNVYN